MICGEVVPHGISRSSVRKQLENEYGVKLDVSNLGLSKELEDELGDELSMFLNRFVLPPSIQLATTHGVKLDQFIEGPS